MLHFAKQELARRRRAACREMAKLSLDGLLSFRQESMYYRTGYDTSGYSMFQGMYLGADGALALCTRSADLRQARLTSVIEDIRIWRDREGANPAEDLRDMLDSYRCRGKRLGVEYHAYGLTAQRGHMVDAALHGFCRTEDASDLVRLQRLVKSRAELEYVRRAGQLADEALAAANRLTVPGARVGEIYGEMQKVVLAGDGDPSASRWPMGHGEEALLVRYHTGHGTVVRNDQVTVEFAAHARTLNKAGYEGHYLNARGYTMGATYPPTWMDWPMIYTGNPHVLSPGMVFFIHMIVLNSQTGLSMCLGETSIVTAKACEAVTHAPRQLVQWPR